MHKFKLNKLYHFHGVIFLFTINKLTCDLRKFSGIFHNIDLRHLYYFYPKNVYL